MPLSSFQEGYNEIPHLTSEESCFAEDHHELILRFLLAKNLSFSDHYDVVVFGYLDAVHRYHSIEKLRQYAFSTVAWKAMNSALSSHRRSVFRKRQNHEVSLYGEDGAEIPMTQYAASFSYDPMEDLRIRMLLHDLAGVLSRKQMDMVQMRLDGCSVRQIAKRHETTMKQVQFQLKSACAVLKQLCYETWKEDRSE